MESENHNLIMMTLGRLEKSIDGVNKRLDTLNGSVAKHADKLVDLDKMNAQMTLTQQQIVKEVTVLQEKNTTEDKDKKEDGKTLKKFWYERIVWAIAFIAILILTKLDILNLK